MNKIKFKDIISIVLKYAGLNILEGLIIGLILASLLGCIVSIYFAYVVLIGYLIAVVYVFVRITFISRHDRFKLAELFFLPLVSITTYFTPIIIAAIIYKNRDLSNIGEFFKGTLPVGILLVLLVGALQGKARLEDYLKKGYKKPRFYDRLNKNNKGS